MNEELTKLVQQAIEGDSTAFERVIEIKARQIIYVSVKLLRNRQDGEDAAQEAMMKMYQSLGQLKDPTSFQSWMYRIVTRVCIDTKRRQVKDEYDYLETRGDVKEMRREFLPQEYIEDADKQKFLMEVIEGLQDHYQACLMFFYYEGMTYQEIAEVMGTTEKIVDNILQRAKRKIKRQLERKYGQEISIASFQGVAAIPVLSQLFELDAALQVAPEAVAQMITGAGVLSALGFGAGAEAATGAAAAGTGTVAGTTTTTGTAATAVTGTLGASSKVIIGLVATATVAGGAAMAFLPGSEPAVALESPPVQEEPAILTLEDMIGQTAAEQLRAYTAGGGVAADWEDYLAQLSVTNLSGAAVGTARLVLYHLEKQEKQLLILEMRDEGRLEVVYRFTDRHESAPQRDELVDCLDGWKQ